MLHCNMKRKRQRCAKPPRILDGSIVALIAEARLDAPQALFGATGVAAAAGDRREFYSFFINHCQG